MAILTEVAMILPADAKRGVLDVNTIGGKAVNLLELAEAGITPPRFFTLTAAAFRQVMQTAGIHSAISSLSRDSREEEIKETAAQLRAQIKACPLPDALRQVILEHYEALVASDQFVAVRSSAIDEDSSDHSFAGMHDSFLFLRGADEVFAAVKGVWASAFNERAISYRLRHEIPLDRIAIAVIIQEMVDATRSGVMFTCNPATDNVHQLVVSSLYGCGEGLVSAGLPADTYTVEKESLEFTAEIEEKTEQLVVDGQNGGLISGVVDRELRAESSLTPQEVQAVASAGIAVERHFGRPQDLEFCFDANGSLRVLQSRPVTKLDERGPAAGNRLIWDNSNIIESYSGVTSPMTFSFIRRAYTIVYHCFSQVMGIAPDVVHANQRTFENMLGLFRGRVYYNLENWYRLIRMFPGFQYNAQFMEAMMGLKEKLDLEDEQPPPTFWRKWFVELPALLSLLARSMWNFTWIRSWVDQFQTNFHDHYDRWSALDFHRLRPHELMKLYYEMEDSLLWNWKAPIINDFYVMIYYGLLKAGCARWCKDESGSLQNDLICGEGGVESAEPAKMLLRLAGKAQQDDALRELITSERPDVLPSRIASDKQFAEFQADFDRYLDLYGFRCMDELKLEEYSLRDRPHLVYQVLRNYLALNDPTILDVGLMEQREQKVRREAEAKARDALGGFLNLPRRFLFQAVLRRARLGVKNRENMRFARTRIYGLLRELLRALGKQLHSENLLEDPQDVFYLTIDEVWDFVKGTSVCTNLRELAELRRREFDNYRAEECERPDDRFETYGMAYHRNHYRNHKEKVVVAEDGVLRGIGCSPGVVSGEVKVIADPRDDVKLAGEILVAERTDPGWVPLYPAVSGLLIERGSILSHSAVVAREMGIPTVVGINGLLATLQSGERVTMDGSAGTVEIDE